jgi:indole-3-glycerol phosphate synthase
MPDYLDVLARDAKETVATGYYQVQTQFVTASVSLRKMIIKSRQNAVITEVKAASRAMENGGATGISVLTEPKHFSGSLSYLLKVREAVKLPILMKDIIINPIQLEAASKIGANAVLLIEALFERGYCELNLGEMITQAHARNLEVLVE